MKTLQFEGFSDDNFGENNVYKDTHDNCAKDEPIVFLVTSMDGRLYVYGHYSPIKHNGCWAIGVSKVDEDDAMPKWPMRLIQGDRPYSPMLEIDAPDDVHVALLG